MTINFFNVKDVLTASDGHVAVLISGFNFQHEVSFLLVFYNNQTNQPGQLSLSSRTVAAGVGTV